MSMVGRSLVAWLASGLLLTACTTGTQRASVPLGEAPLPMTPIAPPPTDLLASPAVETTQQTGQINVDANAALQAELTALRQDVGQQIAGLAVKVDRSVNNYDAWTLRLQAIGQWLPWLLVGVPVLTYVAPKLCWQLVRGAGRRVAERRNWR